MPGQGLDAPYLDSRNTEVLGPAPPERMSAPEGLREPTVHGQAQMDGGLPDGLDHCGLGGRRRGCSGRAGPQPGSFGSTAPICFGRAAPAG
eukprot:1515020-Alexandrium_andersonii.AAC.1